MIYRTWEYGTVQAAVVVDVIAAGRYEAIVCEAGGGPHHPGEPDPCRQR